MMKVVVTWAICVGALQSSSAFSLTARHQDGFGFALQAASGGDAATSVKPTASDEANQQRLDQIRSNLAASRSNGSFVDKKEHDSVSVDMDLPSQPVGADGVSQARLDQIRAARSAESSLLATTTSPDSLPNAQTAGPLSVVSVPAVAHGGRVDVGADQMSKFSVLQGRWEDEPMPLSEECGYSVSN